MELSQLIAGISVLKSQGNLGIEVKGLCLDSRQAKPGYLFAAIDGFSVDGFNFIPSAVAAGATVILCSKWPDGLANDTVVLVVENPAGAIAEIAHRYYNNPSEKIKLFGVTGTNGKTTVATILFKLFRALGYSCGLVSTVENRINETIIPATHTTPDAINISELLSQMADAGCTHVFMESSSHAIHQQRIAALKFFVGIFSNITHDHLDYHKTFDEYIRVKKSFFDALPATSFAISNLDDKRGQIMLQNTAASKRFYSLRTITDFKGKVMENNITGLVMQIDGKELHSRLVGEFNAYNIMAVYAAAICAGEEANEILTHMSMLSGAEGRFEIVMGPKSRKVGIIDYAHTPDALLNVLQTISSTTKGAQQIITVVGCGGNRDKTKRPIMAAVACEYSTHVFFTNDNPRSENPEAILNDMEEGLKSEYRRRKSRVADRREAIAAAINYANDGDIILVAGKGHEKYQEVNGVKSHFDDKEELIKQFDLEYQAQ